MAIVLGANRYGKAETRLVRVVRDGQRHELRDLTVSVALAGDLAATHLTGDNADVLPTDTQKNTVYAFAKRYGVADSCTVGPVATKWRAFARRAGPACRAALSMSSPPTRSCAWTVRRLPAGPRRRGRTTPRERSASPRSAGPRTHLPHEPTDPASLTHPDSARAHRLRG